MTEMRKKRNRTLSLILVVAASISSAFTQSNTNGSGGPQDQSWNRRPRGAGDYQIVLEVSGRVETTRALNMPNPLDLKSICAAKQDAERRAFLSAEGFLSALEKSVDANRRQIEIARLHNELGQLWSYRGDMAKAIEHFESMREALSRGLLDHPEYADDMTYLDEILGITHLRKGELDNCIHNHNAQMCLFPLSKQAEHKLTAGSSAAVSYFKRYLSRRPDNLEVRWLLNLADMTLGQYPQSLPPSLLIPTSPREAREKLAKFPDVAAQAGLDIITSAGGAMMDDFDNDGSSDIVISSVDACESLHYFHNNNDGTFSDWTQKAGLADQIGGINCVQTDYNN